MMSVTAETCATTKDACSLLLNRAPRKLHYRWEQRKRTRQTPWAPMTLASISNYVPQEMGNVILDERQRESMTSTDLATMRVYVSAASIRAVVMKENDRLTNKDVAYNPQKHADALCAELEISLDNDCFRILDVSKAENYDIQICVRV